MKIRGISVFSGQSIEVEIKEGFIKNINLLPRSEQKLPYNYGKLEVGAPANLTLFHYQTGDDSLQIVRTLCKGSVIF